MIPRWTPGQWALRFVIALSPVAAVLTAVPAAAKPQAPFLLVLVVVAVLFALFPASLAGVVALLMPVVWWAGLPDPLHPMCMVAAALLLAGHVAALLASYGPDRLALDPALVRLWVRRAILVLLPVPVIWAVAAALTGERERPGMWVAGLMAACIAATVATVAAGERPRGARELFGGPGRARPAHARLTPRP